MPLLIHQQGHFRSMHFFSLPHHEINLTLMKKTFLIVSFIIIAWSATSQDGVKNAYAYQRTALPGVAPRKTIDESGNEIARPVKPMVNYFIYFEAKPGENLAPYQIWIDGKPFKATTEIVSSPVIMQRSHPGEGPDTLVRKTSNAVMRILQGEELKVKADSKVLKHMKGSKIVVEYTRKGKRCFYQIKEFKKLPPQVLQ